MIHDPLTLPGDPFDLPVPACPIQQGRPVPAADAGNPAAAHSPGAAAEPFSPYPALEAVLAERLRQIHDFGHTPEADGEIALEKFAPILREATADVAERLSLHRADEVTRRKLVKLGAWVLASIDRLDLERRRCTLAPPAQGLLP